MNNNTSTKHSRLNRYCKFMAVLTLIPIFCMLMACVSPFLFYFFNTQTIGLASGGYSFFVATAVDFMVDPTQLALWQAAIATLIDTLQLVVLIYAFYQLRLLFLAYSQSQFFAVKSATYCYNFGKALVLWGMIRFVSEPILTAILSFYSDERFFAISFTSDDMMTFFPAISIMIIGQILKKACQIAEENKQFV